MSATLEIWKIAKRLSPGGQAALLDTARLLLDAEAVDQARDQAAPDPDQAQTRGDNGQRGYVEIKTIKGHQYAYRRWREGKVLKSKYVGKVKSG